MVPCIFEFTGERVYMGTKKDVYMDWIVAADAIEIIAFVAILSKIQFSHQGEILCILLRSDESGIR